MLIRKLLLLSLILILAGCEKTLDKEYCFVGDSLIARWPVYEMFPSQLVCNYGKSGAGLDYLKSMTGRFNGKEVVVEIGSNDYQHYASGNIDEYVEDYLLTVSRLTDKSIYLYSLLPREFANDPVDINNAISQLNEKIRSRLSLYPNIIYMNVYDEFLYDGHINYQYYSDNLHLNTYGYQILTKHLLNYIYEAD